jgi:ABC-2 type transport system permease protein
MRVMAKFDPFTYAVHAFKSLLLKNTPLVAIGGDLTYLTLFAIVSMLLATWLFQRTL